MTLTKEDKGPQKVEDSVSKEFMDPDINKAIRDLLNTIMDHAHSITKERDNSSCGDLIIAYNQLLLQSVAHMLEVSQKALYSAVNHSIELQDIIKKGQK